MILQISFGELSNPDTLTFGLAVLIVSIQVMVAYAGLAIRSGYILAIWSVATIMFVISFLFDVNLVYFWLLVIVECAAVPINLLILNRIN